MKNDSYRFAVLSDIHMDLEDSGKKIYFIHAEKNFKRALEVIKSLGCDFIISAGDQVTNATGATEEWRLYRDLIAASGYRGQVFSALGNHELRFAKYGGCTVADCHREFIDFTGLGDKPVSRLNGKTYYSYTEPVFGDAFIFMSLEIGADTNMIDNFSDEQIAWAEELLERYSRENRRIFLIQHAPIYGFGAGDDTTSPTYKGSIHLSDENGAVFKNNRRFYELVKRYDDVIWLSGHTHVDLRDGVNYSHDCSCHALHIPALAGSTRMIYDENGRHILNRTFYGDAAQGYIADADDEKVVFMGIDFLSGEIYPQYVYTIKGE